MHVCFHSLCKRRENEKKGWFIQTVKRVWKLDFSVQHPLRGNEVGDFCFISIRERENICVSYFADQSPADVNVMQDIVTLVHLYTFRIQASMQLKRAPLRSTDWLATMCSLCFPTCRKLCIAQHPHFPTDSDTGKLVTEGHFAHFYSDSKPSVPRFRVRSGTEVEFVEFLLTTLILIDVWVSLLVNLYYKTSYFGGGLMQHMQVLSG